MKYENRKKANFLVIQIEQLEARLKAAEKFRKNPNPSVSALICEEHFRDEFDIPKELSILILDKHIEELKKDLSEMMKELEEL